MAKTTLLKWITPKNQMPSPIVSSKLVNQAKDIIKQGRKYLYPSIISILKGEIKKALEHDPTCRLKHYVLRFEAKLEKSKRILDAKIRQEKEEEDKKYAEIIHSHSKAELARKIKFLQEKHSKLYEKKK